mmetsp:Transcript_57615/g.117872  ORF Transcript_57615/g.117872 Transcript_57615/m.117872 type:complete len:233 (-) Transcript_57615:60-758(-)
MHFTRVDEVLECLDSVVAGVAITHVRNHCVGEGGTSQRGREGKGLTPLSALWRRGVAHLVKVHGPRLQVHHDCPMDCAHPTGGHVGVDASLHLHVQILCRSAVQHERGAGVERHPGHCHAGAVGAGEAEVHLLRGRIGGAAVHFALQQRGAHRLGVGPRQTVHALDQPGGNLHKHLGELVAHLLLEVRIGFAVLLHFCEDIGHGGFITPCINELIHRIFASQTFLAGIWDRR